MKLLNDFCSYLSSVTSIDKKILLVIFLSIFVAVIFSIAKYILRIVIRGRVENSRKVFFISQSSQVILNVIEVILLIMLWANYFTNFVTLISVVSAAMTIALREAIMNYFCGVYIRIKKPFKVEDRIEVDGLKGDVMNITAFGFELLEVSSKEENGQSTGVVVMYPNSIVLTKPIKNSNKGFKYVWNELTVKVTLDCDLVRNKQELYRIVNSNDTIKSIPRKMMNEIQMVSLDNRVYFNKYDPIIYTKIVDDHIELTIRYLMHPKKARYVESVLWNKIYIAFREGKIRLFLGATPPTLEFHDEDEKFKPVIKEEKKTKKKEPKEIEVMDSEGEIL